MAAVQRFKTGPASHRLVPADLLVELDGLRPGLGLERLLECAGAIEVLAQRQMPLALPGVAAHELAVGGLAEGLDREHLASDLDAGAVVVDCPVELAEALEDADVAVLQLAAALEHPLLVGVVVEQP